MQGDNAKAKAAYQDFLTLWKDGDPDIRIFIAVKSGVRKAEITNGLKEQSLIEEDCSDYPVLVITLA